MKRDTLTPEMQLGAAILLNIPQADIGSEEMEYYLVNKDQIPSALKRGFVLPNAVRDDEPIQTPKRIITPSPALIPQAKTDLVEWIAHTEKFAKECLGVKVDLREQFDFPAELPWKNVLLSFDPGGLTNRAAIDKALKGQKLDVYEEEDVMNYSGSEANDKPTLYIIENSVKPSAHTLGDNCKTPDQLNADGRLYLPQRGYMMTFGLFFFVTKEYLDPKTWTWFPKNRLPGGGVASGCWRPDGRGVYFHWLSPGYSLPRLGARLAIEVKLKT